MSSQTFDAIAALRRLEDAGIPRAQAEAMVQCHQDSTNASRGDLATKADLAELRAETKQDFAQLEAKFGQLEAKFGQLEGKLYKALYIQTGIIISSVVGALAIYRFFFLGG